MYEPVDPEVALSLAYAPAEARGALALLWAFDGWLARVVRDAREPMMTEIRLIWWRDALLAGGEARDPMLADLLASGMDRAQLAAIPEGWAELLAEEPDDDALAAHAQGRGRGLFLAAGGLLGGDDERLAAAGEGWALVDHAARAPGTDSARRALALALPRLESAFATRWPQSIRPLGMIAALAHRDAIAGHAPARRGSPARQWRMLRHSFTGR